jgi:NADH-quinone oxidoreductase subunit I
LRFSNNIYWVATSREEMQIDLLARLKDQATELHSSAPAPKTEVKASAEKEA